MVAQSELTTQTLLDTVARALDQASALCAAMERAEPEDPIDRIVGVLEEVAR